MWLLISIILLNSQVKTVEVLEIFHKKQDCLRRGNHAASIGIPQGMTLNCIHLEGVLRANAKKLQ